MKKNPIKNWMVDSYKSGQVAELPADVVEELKKRYPEDKPKTLKPEKKDKGE